MVDNTSNGGLGALQRGIPRGASVLGAAFGVVAAGAAVGLALERYTIGRAVRRMAAAHDPGEPYGTLRGTAETVMTADGVELHVEVDDPGGWPRGVDAKQPGRGPAKARPAARKPTLLFTHGFCLPQDSWHYQRSAFSGEYRMVFWDQRGHGRSDRPKPRADLSVDVLGEDLYAVLEATCPTGPVILVGHSMGGMTMMALAEAHPELFGDRVVGAALIATSAGEFAELGFGLPRAGAKVFHRAAPSMFELLARQRGLVERGRRAGGDLGLVLTKRYSFGTDTPEAVVRFVQELIQSTPIEVIAQFFPIFREHDKVGAVPVFDRVPALVVAGDKDLLLPVEHSRVLADAIPSADFVVVEGGGHVVMLEHPDEVNAALRRLVERVAERAGAPGDPDSPPSPRRAAR